MNVWIVALCEREESKRVTRRLGIWKTMLLHAKDGCGSNYMSGSQNT